LAGHDEFSSLRRECNSAEEEEEEQVEEDFSLSGEGRGV
jgi:hypothetical protein